MNEDQKKPLNEGYIGIADDIKLPTDMFSERTKKTHKAIYERSIDFMNTVSFKLEGADRSDSNSENSVFRDLKKSESSLINSSFLHALFFHNISDQNSSITTSMLAFRRLNETWGTFDRWQEDFIATCSASRNGWAVTAYCYLINRYINIVVDDDANGVPFGCIPLIVMDMHEHAYFHDYLADKQLYIKAMMLEFDWEIINQRFEKANRVADILQPKSARE